MRKKLSSDILREHKGISFPGVTTSFFCHDGKGRVFMGKRSKNARDEHGRWDIGGGGLKHGHTMLDNVKREIKEEYNAEPKAISFLGVRELFRKLEDGTPTHWIGLDYIIHVANPETVKIMEPEFFEDSGWFEIDNLPTPLHSTIPSYLEEYKDQLNQILKAKSID